MKRLITDFNKTQALINSINLKRQFEFDNPFINSQLLETQRLLASLSCDIPRCNPIVETYQNTFDYEALSRATQLSANFSNSFAYVHEILSCTLTLKKQIEEVQKLTSFATLHLNQSIQFQEHINKQFSNNYFASLQFESDKLRKIFESMIPQVALNISSVPKIPNDSFFFPPDTVTYYETDDIKITEQNTAEGKHFTLSCSDSIEIIDQEPTIFKLQKSLTEIKEKLPCLFLTNLSKEEISLLISTIVGTLSIITTSISTYVTHQDAERAHCDAVRAHQDAIISQQDSQIQIEQGNKIIDLLEKNQTIDIKLLEELRTLREAQKLNIKNSNVHNEKRH